MEPDEQARLSLRSLLRCPSHKCQLESIFQLIPIIKFSSHRQFLAFICRSHELPLRPRLHIIYKFCLCSRLRNFGNRSGEFDGAHFSKPAREIGAIYKQIITKPVSSHSKLPIDQTAFLPRLLAREERIGGSGIAGVLFFSLFLFRFLNSRESFFSLLLLTEMQEHMWARLRELWPGAGVIHAT